MTSMTTSEVIWSAGDAPVQREIERVLAEGLSRATPLHESAHRIVHQITLPKSSGAAEDPLSLILKIHRSASGRHPFRESLKRRLGRSPAQREWRALVALHEKGVPVPRPRAWGRLRNGDECIVSDFLEGEPLQDHFREAPPEKHHQIADAMARAIGRLHAAGYQHGDLHLGNLWHHGHEVFLLDLERARPQRDAFERLVDLAKLEFSLARSGWPSALRRALRDRLEPDDRFEWILRHFLRDYLRGRARRVLRTGRNWSAANVGPFRGLRDVSLDATSLATIFESAERDPDPRLRRDGRIRMSEAPLDGRIVLIKRVAAGGFRRALGDRLRGSSAARAFLAGQRLALLTDGIAKPLAYLEERRFGLPLQSWLIVEKVGDEDLDRLDPPNPETASRVAHALGEWLADLHSWGLSHRDLKAGNVRVAISAPSIRFWLIDLEDLSGPTELSDEARLHALGQLNASLSDDSFGLACRREALDRYLTRAPFAAGANAAGANTVASEIARQSLARGHRWRGHGCDLADRETL